MRASRRVMCASIALAALLTGCATGPMRARVLDAETREPIAGAVVLGVWTRVVGIGLSHSEDVGLAESETDGHGRFELEREGTSGVRRDEAVTVYKFGYIAWSNSLIFPGWQRRDTRQIPEVILLERFPAGLSHRDHLSFIDQATLGRSSSAAARRLGTSLERERGASTHEPLR